MTNMKSVEQGAATQCYVATHPSLAGKTGRYFSDCNITEPVPAALAVPFEIGIHGNALASIGAFEILTAVLTQEDRRLLPRQIFTVSRRKRRIEISCDLTISELAQSDA